MPEADPCNELETAFGAEGTLGIRVHAPTQLQKVCAGDWPAEVSRSGPQLLPPRHTAP